MNRKYIIALSIVVIVIVLAAALFFIMSQNNEHKRIAKAADIAKVSHFEAPDDAKIVDFVATESSADKAEYLYTVLAEIPEASAGNYVEKLDSEYGRLDAEKLDYYWDESPFASAESEASAEGNFFSELGQKYGLKRETLTGIYLNFYSDTVDGALVRGNDTAYAFQVDESVYVLYYHK